MGMWNVYVQSCIHRDWEWNLPYHTGHQDGCMTSPVHCLRDGQSEQIHPKDWIKRIVISMIRYYQEQQHQQGQGQNIKCLTAIKHNMYRTDVMLEPKIIQKCYVKFHTFSFILQAPWRLACSGLAETVSAATVWSNPDTSTGSILSGTVSIMSVLDTHTPGGLFAQRRSRVHISWSTLVLISVCSKLINSSPGWLDMGSGMNAWPLGLKGKVEPCQGSKECK